MRYCITFSYDGTRYHGWQFQPNGITVQEAVETALHTLLREKVNVVGAGRTDQGVHARMMAAHFDWSEQLDCNNLLFKLNALTPPDIAFHSAKRVADDWHARFSALARTYHYYITTKKNAFLPLYSLRLYCTLDIEKMNQAAALLLEHEDFGCFCKSHSSNKTNICHVTEAHWDYVGADFISIPDCAGSDRDVADPVGAGFIPARDCATPDRDVADPTYISASATTGGIYRFRITANRFLRNMVRAIVGTLIEVGRGRLSVDDFQKILDSGDRRMAGESVPACGLFLEDVRY